MRCFLTLHFLLLLLFICSVKGEEDVSPSDIEAKNDDIYEQNVRPPTTLQNGLKYTDDFQRLRMKINSAMEKAKRMEVNHLLQQVKARAKLRMPERPVISLSSIAALLLYQTFKVPSSCGIVLMCLVGSSLGYISFLYFISLGYAASLAICAGICLWSFNGLNDIKIPILTNIHTGLVLLWAIRLFLFLLHREFVSWPEWHVSIKNVNERQKTLEARLPIWIATSLFYASMFSPCFSRMVQALSAHDTELTINTSIWGFTGKFGICLQVVGLIIESIADHQKGKFKRIPGNRSSWCNVGLWSFSTHPNYVGESIFWLGTYFGGMGSQSITQIPLGICSFAGVCGILAVMNGACKTLTIKQNSKYKDNKQYLQFAESHGVLGPLLKRNKIK